MLIENVKMTLDNESVSEKFNNYFSPEEIDDIVSKFKTHLSIVKIKKHFRINTTFSFSPKVRMK